jgi:maltose alpha-D-glucosyltransferase/alpha-amylase
VIASYVKERRWFRAKARGLTEATIAERYPLRLDGEEVTFAVVDCRYEDGGSDRYILPIAIAAGDEAERIRSDEAHLVIGAVTPEVLAELGRAEDGTPAGALLYDALGSGRLLAAMLDAFDHGVALPGARGTLVFRPLPGFAEAKAGPKADVTPRPTKTEQTNTSIVYGNTFILKIVRQLDDGTSAELEMGAFLTEHGYASAPAVVGAVEIERTGREPSTVGILHRFVPNEGDAWTFTLAHLATTRLPASYTAIATVLGKRVGEMHVVLAGGAEPAFAVERLAKSARIVLGDAVKAEARALTRWLHAGDEEKIAAAVERFVEQGEDPPRMRVHGDLHLGQILSTIQVLPPFASLTTLDQDFIIIDFEGEPSRPLAERKAKRAPFADVAGMLRSFDYAAAACRLSAEPSTDVFSTDEAREWYRHVASTFLEAYRNATASCAALRTKDETFARSLDFYLLEKCLYELRYEANNRPDWIAIPQSGIRDLLDGDVRT